MNRREALKKLKTSVVMVLRGSATDFQEALDIAIEALSEPPRKTGRWIDYGVTQYECSECYHISNHIRNFCPDCGAEMRGED